MNNQHLKICNGSILTPYRVIHNGTVVVTGGKITEVCEGDVEVPDATVIDAMQRNDYDNMSMVGWKCFWERSKLFKNCRKQPENYLMSTTLTSEKRKICSKL